ncbi:hypothetical protein ACOKM3_06630 [Streptomyces sp. BH106]|uniref:hypothetical protein n=1 Tax=Streptomyces sp. BH106 TaxID=3410409 RepID=UPI003CF9F4A4
MRQEDVWASRDSKVASPARRADIAQLDDASEVLRQWLRAMEEYFSAFSGRRSAWGTHARR